MAGRTPANKVKTYHIFNHELLLCKKSKFVAYGVQFFDSARRFHRQNIVQQIRPSFHPTRAPKIMIGSSFALFETLDLKEASYGA